LTLFREVLRNRANPTSATAATAATDTPNSGAVSTVDEPATKYVEVESKTEFPVHAVSVQVTVRDTGVTDPDGAVTSITVEIELWLE